MDVSYNKLFKLLIDKEMKKMEFAKVVGLSLIHIFFVDGFAER